MDDRRHPQFRLFQELRDRDELGIVLALLGPMDADERLVARRFHPDDRAARGTAFDRFEGDAHGRVHSEELAHGGKDRFGWHGRGQTSVKNRPSAKGNPVASHSW